MNNKKRTVFIMCIISLLFIDIILASPSQAKTVILQDGSLNLDFVGYKNSDIIEAPLLCENKLDVINTINYNIVKMNHEFKLLVRDFNMDMLPKSLNELERYFVSELKISDTSIYKNDIVQITINIQYNDAGKVILDLKHGNPLSKIEYKAQKIKNKAVQILKKTRNMSDYQKLLYLHDYLVRNCKYGISDIDDNSPYGTLIKQVANDEGFAETLQMLLNLSEIENRVVWSRFLPLTKNNAGVHLFNKVKLEGHWFNVDISTDASMCLSLDYSKYIIRNHLLVTDKVKLQNYFWEMNRYPVSEIENNWHMRNGLYASDQITLERIVNKYIQERKTYISIWINDFEIGNVKNKYDIHFIKKDKRIASYTTTFSSSMFDKPFATAILFQIKYK